MATRRHTSNTETRPDRDGVAELEEGLRIDRDDLDRGLVEQPERYYDVARAHAEAVAARDAAKLDLEYVQANVDAQLRARAEESGEKTTEARLAQEMRLDPKYDDARRILLECSTAVDRLSALKESFQQRSYMLRELVTLTISEKVDRAGASGAYEASGRLAQRGEEARNEYLKRRGRGSRRTA